MAMDSHTRSLYRQFHRLSMQAVRYASPARYMMRDKLRRQFRHPLSSLPPPMDDPTTSTEPTHTATADAGPAASKSKRRASEDSIQRTMSFLHRAATRHGIEHKIVRNLCHVEWSRQNELRSLLRVERLLYPPHTSRLPSATKAMEVDSGARDEFQPYAKYEALIDALNDEQGLLLT